MRLTELAVYATLLKHQQTIASEQMQTWFLDDNQRFHRYSLQVDGLLLDYSRNRINDTTLDLLIQLAEQSGLANRISDLFSGKPINVSEKRAVLHTALRGGQFASPDTIEAIENSLEKVRSIVEQVRSGQWHGVTGKPIKHIVNIGIGGSHLGPMMALEALRDIAATDLTCHFISSIDLAHLQTVLANIDPAATLFIVSSKSFNTIETLTNAKTILSWLIPVFGDAILQKQFVAVTAAPAKAKAFGIPEQHIIGFWDWVGGRYSVWSPVGLPLAIMIGNAHFADLLAGAYAMDEHFRTAPFRANMPVLLAVLGIWYINFFHCHAHAIIPYAHRLRHLIDYLQQADMESNGKSVDIGGHPLDYHTGPVIFGAEGINGQHAYHQALHQGQHFIPADFILVANSNIHENPSHHDILLASCLSQATALLQGKTVEAAQTNLLKTGLSESEADSLAPHQAMPGNKPSNIIVMDTLSPRNLGALIALYEHKIFVQGVIWHINSFDQWGVELGKELLPTILDHIQQHESELHIDPSIAALIKYLKRTKN